MIDTHFITSIDRGKPWMRTLQASFSHRENMSCCKSCCSQLRLSSCSKPRAPDGLSCAKTAWHCAQLERISRSLWILMFPLTDYLLLILFVSTLQNLTDANACGHSTYLKIQQDLRAQTNKLPPMNLKTKRHLEPQSISPKLCSTQRFPACNFAGMGFVSSWSCRHTWPWA